MTTEPKLYRVTIECEVWVIATSREDAESINHASEWHDILSDDVRYNAGITARVVTSASSNNLPWRAEGCEDAEDATIAVWAVRTREAVAREKHEAKMAAAQVALPVK